MRKKNQKRSLYFPLFFLSALWGVIWLSPDNVLQGCPVPLGDHGHKSVYMIHSVFSLFSLILPLNLRALLHRTAQRILTKFTIFPRAFKRWNRVYCLNHRSYMSLLCNCINHLLSKTLKRKIEAIILINEADALETTDGWNMVCYLSCLLWTLRCVSLCWCELWIQINTIRGNLIL